MTDTINDYVRLREILDTHPSGCPDSPEIQEILRIFFTSDEVHVALGLGFRPLPLKTVAQKRNVDETHAFACLESLANKGIVFAKQKDGVWHYALLPVMPGLFEFPYMKNNPDPMLEKLDTLWKKYMVKLGKDFGSKSTSFSRIVPIQELIESKPDVLTYENLNHMIDQAKVFGIGKCACRSIEKKCNAPIEACMMFDDTCTYLVERGFGRYITKEEMKEKLKVFDALGLVHQINNAMDRLTFICNCCPCCCGLLRSYTDLNNPYVLTTSAYIPQLDETRCIGCGVCADERCPMKVIEMKHNHPVINEDRCIGCGLCVTGCPQEALSLIRRSNVKEPAPTNREMGLRILKDKGKLEAFLPHILS
ncbi:MAG: 4Fe-4S binding protein [Desulfobacterales bacterium]|nr:4Fe-4S binding protein [Desulfobacterales bacterium]